MLDPVTVAVLGATFIAVYLYINTRTSKGIPPGPKGYPIFGHLNLIYYGRTNQFHIKTAKWGEQYGGIYSMPIGSVPVVMVTDYDLIREALVDQADIFTDRPLHNDFFRLLIKDNGGLLLENGEAWKQVRRFTMQSMRDFGFGKQSIEEKIMHEAQEVVAEIDKLAGKEISFNQLLNRAVSNVICNVLFGKRNDFEDQEFKKLVRDLNKIFKYGGFQNIFIFLPWYSFWLMPILQPKIWEILKATEGIEAFISKVILDHCQSFDENNIRDFVDLYLEMEKKEPNQVITEKRIFTVIMDMFMAGTESVSTTLLWAILFLCKNQEVQIKCRKEIEEVIGFAKLPSYKDKANMPYMEATIAEVLRLGNITPVSPFHNTEQTTKLRGYTIPKNTMLMLHYYAINMDPKRWDEPFAFKPERFLGENGTFKKPDGFIPFGLGRRACLGESLARMELFLFLTSFLQKFEFRVDDPEKLPTVDNTCLGLTLIPEDFYVTAHRFNEGLL